MNGQAMHSLDRFTFRGRVGDAFARIENHLTPILERLAHHSICRKAPYLFGDKFQLVLDHSHAKGIWQHPQHVTPILKDLQPYAKARGMLGHGTIEETAVAFIVRRPGQEDDGGVLIEFAVAQILVNELERLTERLERQPAHRGKRKIAA